LISCMGKVIAVAVPKGGVGKTTTVVNLAASLAVAEKKTLIIDFDTSGACSIALGFTPDKIKGDILDLFSYTKSIDKVIHKTEIPFLDFIPSQVSTYQSEQRLEKLSANIMFIANVIRYEADSYDYIIIDCPPYLKGMTTNAMAVSDSLLIPIRAENFSLDALGKIMQHYEYVKRIYNSRLKIEGILFTMFEAHTKVSQLAMAQLMQNYGQYLFKITIPKNVTISESTFKGIPAVLYKAVSKGSQAYLNLALEIMKKS
ncbi:MAG: ParA family protein, partial [Ignavibacteriaceae bacterium]|nr:ParA family protein [Ignavibacteriaceae bacterium]